jgi:hypothetical protein
VRPQSIYEVRCPCGRLHQVCELGHVVCQCGRVLVLEGWPNVELRTEVKK